MTNLYFSESHFFLIAKGKLLKITTTLDMSEPCPLAANIDFGNPDLLKAVCNDWAIRKTFEFKTEKQL